MDHDDRQHLQHPALHGRSSNPLPTDTQADKPKKFAALRLTLFVCVGFAVGWLGVPLLPFLDYLESYNEALVALSLVLPLWWVGILVHELGHVALGRLQGLKTWRVIAGPVLVHPRRRGVQFRYNWTQSKGGGLAYAYTEDPDDPRLRGKHFWMVLGGPLASLLLAASAFGLVALFRLRVYQTYELYPWEVWLGLCLSFLGTVAAWHAVTSLMPYRAAWLMSDGLQLLKLVRDPTFLGELRETYRYTQLFHGKARPRDWDLSLLEPFERENRARHGRYGAAVARYYHCLDRRDHAQAKEHLDAAFAYLPEMGNLAASSLRFEAAYFYAFHLNDAAMAQELFEVGSEASGDRVEQARARIALLLESNQEEALQLATRTLRYLEGERDSGIVDAEQTWVREMAERAAQEKLVQM